jgi:hypothetical protein
LADETLLQFLERRERELQTRIAVAELQAAEMQAELDEVRRAKAQLKPPTDGSLGLGHLGTRATQHTLEVEGRKGLGGMPIPEYVVEELSEKTTRKENDPVNMTLRQLVELAFKTRRFNWYGASNNDLRTFIKEMTGREIDRTSLSPTLSRLREDGILASSAGGKWRLAKD